MQQNFQHGFENSVILIVEDDYEIGDIIEKYIKLDNMLVIRAMDGQQAIDALSKHNIDLILLDIKLPKLSGWDVLKIIRQKNSLPIIMLTALDDQVSKIMGLKMGADDFINKPFNPNEVVARIQAVLRRTIVRKASENVLTHKDFEINLENHNVYIINGQTRNLINLTLTEYNILVLMTQTPNKVFSRDELIQNCMPERNTLDRTVDSHMSNLRKKFEKNGINGLLMNVRGVGYRLNHKNEA